MTLCICNHTMSSHLKPSHLGKGECKYAGNSYSTPCFCKEFKGRVGGERK